MKPPSSRFARALEAQRRTLGSVLAVLLVANLFSVVRHAVRSDPAPPPSFAGGIATTDGSAAGLETPPGALGRGSVRGGGARGTPALSVRTADPGTVIPGKGTVPFGIDGNKLKIVYYWKGDQTKSSPFLRGTGQEGNVDEGEAFTKLIAYINRHADGGELMGFRFDLHGWRLDPLVIEAGKGDDQIRAAERIVEEEKPLAAVSSHGSISAYVCPQLAQAGIFNISTYDLDWGLTDRTSGFCLPQGLAWGRQVDLSLGYLQAWAADAYTGGPTLEPRRYGLLYAEYPGLVDSGPTVRQMMLDAGIPVVETATVDPDLTTAGRQQPGVVAKFRAAGVNTIVAPDSGSLITFTHAAQAAGFTPDYYVWPCSGEDSTGMVRLYNAGQWTRAKGLTCYDRHLNADLTNDDNARRTQWYEAYQEMAPGAEPPAPTSLVYQSLLPLVAGITHAGRDLTIERFKEGLTSFERYRYDAIDGRTTNPGNILVSIDAPDGSQVGDAAKVYWDPSTTTAGNATPGTYRFPENRRYVRGSAFS